MVPHILIGCIHILMGRAQSTNIPSQGVSRTVHHRLILCECLRANLPNYTYLAREYREPSCLRGLHWKSISQLSILLLSSGNLSLRPLFRRCGRLRSSFVWLVSHSASLPCFCIYCCRYTRVVSCYCNREWRTNARAKRHRQPHLSCLRATLRTRRAYV